MNLLDHFHPPLAPQRHWHAFHNAWATLIAASLNQQLPPGYFAEPNVQFGIEIDVATFDANGVPPSVPANPAPGPPTGSVALAKATDIIEVSVFHHEGGAVLAGVLEIVSPANKDRPAHRAAFAGKCATYLREGIGVAVIDIVTERGGDLHGELLQAISPDGLPPTSGELFACAYRPVERDSQPRVEYWHFPLALGAPLPWLPLWLRGDILLSLDLHEIYSDTCRQLRIA